MILWAAFFSYMIFSEGGGKMDAFERDLDRLADLGFDREYRERLRAEYKTENRESVRRYVRAVVCVYDDRKEFVDAV